MVYMFHVFIFYFTGDGHLGCFHVLAIVNSDAVTIGVYVSFGITLYPDIFPRVWCLGHLHTCNSIFSFLGTSILFSIVAVSIYIPTNSVGGFPFLYILSSIYCLWIFFDNVCSDQCEVLIIVVLICISLVINDVECLHVFVAHL